MRRREEEEVDGCGRDFKTIDGRPLARSFMRFGDFTDELQKRRCAGWCGVQLFAVSLPNITEPSPRNLPFPLQPSRPHTIPYRIICSPTGSDRPASTVG